MKKEKNIDCMKYRKHTHIAGVDVENIIAEKGNCILTIEECYYSKNIDVSGNNTDGYFIEFKEDIKPMVVNSTNRKQIAKIVKDLKKCQAVESRNIGNWSGLQIELYFDATVRMMGKTTGGIKVKYQLPVNKADDKQALIKLSECKTLEDLKTIWVSLTADEKTLPTVLSKKESLKKTLK